MNMGREPGSLKAPEGCEAPVLLPLGRNCQLGAALTRFGYHETSLFRWADVSLERVQAALEGANPFAGPSSFRFSGTALGTLDHAGMRRRLADAPATARVNTIVREADGESYVHGVQLTLQAAARLSLEEIRAANADKVAHLVRKFRAQMAGGARPIAVRLEWTPVVDAEPFVRLGAALRRLRPEAELCVVSPAGGVEGEHGGVAFVGLSSPLPQLSDVMNVGTTIAEWTRLFAAWGVAPQGEEKPYIFDL